MKERIEIGDCVKTTYGVGKITRAYIVYSDDGYFWHLTYMTNNPKISIGIFTKDLGYELFPKLTDNKKYEAIENNIELVDKIYEQELEEPICYVPVDNRYPRNASLYDDHKFIKLVKNKEDLIEPGDIVEIKMNDFDGSLFYQPNSDADIHKMVNDLTNMGEIVALLPKNQYKENAIIFNEE